MLCQELEETLEKGSLDKDGIWRVLVDYFVYERRGRNGDGRYRVGGQGEVGNEPF